MTHPLVAGLAEHMLGPDYEIVEVAFDAPLPGAVHQPWHRDFAMPDETREGGTLSSLAFNASTVDVTPDMGPFEFVPGTHLDPDDSFEHRMFPPQANWGLYEQRSRVRCPRRGDVSARTGLAIHRERPTGRRSRDPCSWWARSRHTWTPLMPTASRSRPSGTRRCPRSYAGSFAAKSWSGSSRSSSGTTSRAS